MLCTRTPPNPASGCPPRPAGHRASAGGAECGCAQPHSDADRVAAIVRDELGSVSTQAVYDVLRACVGAGLLRPDRACGLTRALRDADRRQPPPSRVQKLRHGRRCRLCRWACPMPGPGERAWFRGRRGRGRVLGTVVIVSAGSHRVDTMKAGQPMCPETPNRPTKEASRMTKPTTTNAGTRSRATTNRSPRRPRARFCCTITTSSRSSPVQPGAGAVCGVDLIAKPLGSPGVAVLAAPSRPDERLGSHRLTNPALVVAVTVRRSTTSSPNAARALGVHDAFRHPLPAG